jgi:hypothetical protein
MYYKRCTRCFKRKRLTQFARNRSKPDGYSSQCRVCKDHYRRQHYATNKAQYLQWERERKRRLTTFIRSLKTKCSCCSETHPAALDFHHLDPTKKEGDLRKALVRGWSEKRILIELAKCIVLCANCHRKLHWQQSVCPV